MPLFMVKLWIAGINQLCYRFSAALAELLIHLQVVAGGVKLQTTIHDDQDFLRILQAREKLVLSSYLLLTLRTVAALT